MIFINVIILIICVVIASKFDIPLYYSLISSGLGFLLFSIKKIRNYGLFVLFISLIFVRANEDYPFEHISNLFKINPSIKEFVEFKVENRFPNKKNFVLYKINIKKISDFNASGSVYLMTKNDSLKIGNYYSSLLELSKFLPNTNPNQFNYEQYSFQKNIHGIAVNQSKFELKKNMKFSYNRFFFFLRNKILKRIKERFPYHHTFISAILLGEREYKSERVINIQKAGLQHLLAVSGLHVGIISFIFLILLKFLIPNRKIAYFFTIFSLFIYGQLCLWSPSVMRAVCMISLFLLSRILEKKVSGIRILALSFILLIFIEPLQLFSVGFQLSFTAVWILFTYIKFIKKILIKMNIDNFIQKFLLFISISFFLSVCLSPITIYYFNEFNLNGIASNFFGITLISFILPLSILILFLPKVTLLISIYHNSFLILMFLFDYSVKYLSKLPLRFSFLNISDLQFVIAFSLVIFFPLLFFFRNRKSKIFVFGLIFLFGISFVGLKKKNNNFIVTYFDCGLGDLALIEIDKKILMIDCGPGNDEKKSFKYSALPYMKNKGFSKIDYLLITHGHFDHYGGLRDIASVIKIDTLLITKNFYEQNIVQKYKNEMKNTEILICSAPKTFKTENGKIEIIHPDKKYYDKNKNNMSLVVKISYGDAEFLFTGDLEEEGEDYIIRKYPNLLDCDVLKVGHHGSCTSSDLDFLQKVTPEYAVISSSIKNKFNFPHKQTLNRLKLLEEKLFITGEDGAVQMETDGKVMRIKTIFTKEYYFDDSLNE